MDKEKQIQEILVKFHINTMLILAISKEIIDLDTMTEEEYKAHKVAQIEAEKAQLQEKLDALETKKASLLSIKPIIIK